MPLSPHHNAPQSPPGPPGTRRRRSRILAGLAALAAVTATLAVTQQQQPQNPMDSSSSQPRPWASSQPAAIRMPDANAQMEMQQQAHSKKDKTDAANTERRRQIADDAAKLLELATELKAEVDKTDKDTLSLQVIRKAESIERLAKGVKEKMKLSEGTS